MICIKREPETFFEIRDDNNCERNFNAILSFVESLAGSESTDKENNVYV